MMTNPKVAEFGARTRWKPGQSGNPKGRPIKHPITTALQESLSEESAKEIAEVLIARAAGGDLDAARFIADRLEGKAIARTESGGPGDFTLDDARKILKLGKYRDPNRDKRNDAT
jgi:Family of unknown function (DUF5681)